MIDIEGLLADVLPDSPCGEDLEYSAVDALNRTAQGKPEQQVGDTIVPAEEPDWGLVRRGALELFPKTKDLRVTILLANASIRLEGWPGLRDALSLLDGLIDRYWVEVHPQLDPDDDNDPTMRVNLIASLNDAATTLTYLREAPLVDSVMGRFGLRDILIASSELTHPAGSENGPPETHEIEAAFKSAELEKLQGISAAINRSVELLAGMEARLMTLVGAANAPDMTGLSSLLLRAAKELDRGLAMRPDAIAVTAEETAGEDAGAGGPAADGTVAARPQAARGPIADRDDVRRVLDEICDYYREHEPSSPIPLLLVRAKRLITKDFMAIVQDIAPDGLQAVETLRGPEGDDGG